MPRCRAPVIDHQVMAPVPAMAARLRTNLQLCDTE